MSDWINIFNFEWKGKNGKEWYAKLYINLFCVLWFIIGVLIGKYLL